MKLTLFIFGLLIFNTSYAEQKYYKWTDDKDVVHYSKEKPSDQHVNEVIINPTKPSVDVYHEKTNQEPSDNPVKTIDERFNDRREKKKQNKIDKKKLAYECKAAKRSLTKFKKAVAFRRQDKNGEYIYLEDAKRTSLIKQFKKTIRKTCK